MIVARWLRFNLVGVAGFAVQLATLAVLTRTTAWPLGLCVAIAVLTAVLHNFYWHERYTWRSRAASAPTADAPHRGLADRNACAKRCLAFTLSNGAISLVSNVILTTAVATLFARLPLLLANVIAVALTSLVNFLVADRVIFRPPAA